MKIEVIKCNILGTTTVYSHFDPHKGEEGLVVTKEYSTPHIRMDFEANVHDPSLNMQEGDILRSRENLFFRCTGGRRIRLMDDVVKSFQLPTGLVLVSQSYSNA